MELALSFANKSIKAPVGVPNGDIHYLQTLLSNATLLFIIVGSFLIVIYIVWAGILWITSGGDKAKVTAARGRLTWAIVGFIIILISFFIISAIGYFFKVNLLKIV